MKTQKLFMAFTAFAVLSLSGCTQDEELLISSYSSFDDPNAVLFGTYMGKAPQSRGKVLDNVSLKAKGFGVYAYYTGKDAFTQGETNQAVPNFMCNQQVTWNATATYPGTETPGMWTYNPVKYWPSNYGEKLSFFAYAPYTATPVAAGKPGITSLPDMNTEGDPKIGYTLSENPAEQLDILYSGDMENLIKQNVDQKVQFNFSHAMSRIGFKRVIEVDEVNPDYDNGYDDEKKPQYSLADGTKVVINKVSLSSTEFYKSGTLNLATGEWEGLSNQTQTYTLTAEDFTAEGMTATKDNSKEPVQLNKDDKYLMIFPSRINEQNYIPIDITVEFDVITQDPNISGGESKITSQVTSTFDFEFVKGKFYNFVLHIGLTSVKLDAQVLEWNHIWDEQDNQNLDGEIVVNTPNNNTATLIYDANGGKFLNGSSQYIVTAPVGNFSADSEYVDHNPEYEARFFVKEFNKENIKWVKADGDTHQYEFFGWTDQKFTHKDYIENYQDEETGEMQIPVYYGGEAIFVEKKSNHASRTIYAWWPGEETVL